MNSNDYHFEDVLTIEDDPMRVAVFSEIAEEAFDHV